MNTPIKDKSIINPNLYDEIQKFKDKGKEFFDSLEEIFSEYDTNNKDNNSNFLKAYKEIKSQGYPFQLEEFIKKIGISIRYEILEDGISGKCEQEEGKQVIIINKRHSNYRQRFTIAHELGHIIMHGFERCRNDNPYEPEERIEEQQANRFAANLLMPYFQINKIFKEKDKEKGENIFTKLQEEFDTSADAIMVRLNTLGFIKGW